MIGMDMRVDDVTNGQSQLCGRADVALGRIDRIHDDARTLSTASDDS
jgi:hypothetical protein